MIKHLHGIDGLRKATQFLNSGQTTVMAFDAPLFALAKFAQWKWPGPHGEDKFIETFMVPHLLLLQILIPHTFSFWSVPLLLYMIIQ